MADDMENETGFSQDQIRTSAQIVAAALAEDRAQNQTPPASSNQPVVEERQILEPASDNQASVSNTVPIENDVIKQLAELKDKVEKMSVVKEKDPITNASGKFQSRGKTYPGLEIFMTDFEEQLIKSPEPSFEQLVEGIEFMVGMTQAGTEAEWSKKISEFEDFLGIGDEASKMVQEQKAKA
ncbi:hypothetical protein JCGZ_04944 [Jatropha curcas]|uniref:Uncharacterized protein n=1 Tax=Jatropha curcas TaxID=180498 RepID=A0A067JKK5_JATCU|nr:hypothetical protein JCGZ_04944 [Jatropha curcas]